MLAPRKKLWSTPIEAIKVAIGLLQLRPNDIVYDIGCGDGNFVVQCAKDCINTNTLPIKIVGVEIESDRADVARKEIAEANIPEDIASVVTCNALEYNYEDGKAFFMYLIPRGLRIILPILQKISHPIRIVTFMNPLPDIIPTKEIKISTAQHLNAQWPLYYYETTK